MIPVGEREGRVPASVFYIFSPFFVVGEFPFELSLLVRGPAAGGKGGRAESVLLSSSHGAANHLHMLEMRGKTRRRWQKTRERELSGVGRRMGERGRRASFVGRKKWGSVFAYAILLRTEGDSTNLHENNESFCTMISIIVLNHTKIFFW